MSRLPNSVKRFPLNISIGISFPYECQLQVSSNVLFEFLYVGSCYIASDISIKFVYRASQTSVWFWSQFFLLIQCTSHHVCTDFRTCLHFNSLARLLWLGFRVRIKLFLHKFRRKTVWLNLTVQCLLVISYLLKHLIIRHIDILHTFLKFKNFIHELCSMVFRFNKKNVSHISDVEGLDEWYDGAKILILSRSNFFQIFLKVIG